VTLSDEARTEPKPTHPKGWEPGVTWSPGKGGTMVVPCPSGEADPAFWALVMADWGLDPALTEIVPDSVEIRVWDQAVGNGVVNRARYYRCRIRPRRAGMSAVDVDELARLIMRKKTRKDTVAVPGGVAFIVNLADTQVGKAMEEGGGTPETVARVIAALDAAGDRLRELRKMGRNIVAVFIVGMGDVAEGTCSFYSNILYTIDCTRREQLQIVRMLITYAVDTFVDLVPRIVLAAVPGNHGENRGGGKGILTTISDSDDLAVFEQVGESLAQNPGRYGHVEVVLSDDLVLKLDVCGIPVGWTHMHQGAGGQKGIENWWRGQVMGNRPISEAQILNTAHYHHLLISESTGRTVIQMPAMDGGSRWWTDKTGENSPPGLVTYLVGVDCGPRGWSDLVVL
jgi:hypothetical protein